MKSIRVEDVLEVIDADIIIMKIDIEGYECKVDIYTHHINAQICMDNNEGSPT